MSKALTGKWQWNGVIEPMYDASYVHYVWFKSGFTSNGQRFEGIRFRFDDFWRLEYTAESGYVEAGAGYHEDDYATPFEQYRVIDFGTGSEANDDSDGTFIKWFLSNVTRYGTVAEKLEIIAKNEKAVYQSGYDKALEKGGYNQGFKDGREKEWSDFWDAYQPDTRVVPYQFSSAGWNDNTFFPKRNMIANDNIYGAFYGTGVTDLVKRLNDCGVKLDTSNATQLGTLFSFAYSITTIPKISAKSASSLDRAFNECMRLKTITCLEVHQNVAFPNVFYNCKALENITIEGEIGNDINFQWSTLLTKASITNIIEHLSLNASGKTLTLSKAAVDREFEGVSGADFTTIVEGSISAEWIGWIASRSNWNITLV